MIKAVAYAVATYSVACFEFPKKWREGLDAAIANYGGGTNKMKEEYIGSVGTSKLFLRLMGYRV